ncbi:MAG TPA: hypothetical protein VFP44_22820 [Usitatibacter sp.]|nr:hypothetical protein [Usitatibacter sp.]
MPVPRLSPSNWRILVAFLGMAVGALVVMAASSWPRYSAPGNAGTLGASFGAAKTDRYRVVTRMAPDSPLVAMDVKVGDLVRFDSTSDDFRSQFESDFEKGEAIGVRVRSPAGTRHVDVAAGAAPGRTVAEKALFLAALVTSFLACLIAVAIGMRQAMPPVRFLVLALFLVSIDFSVGSIPAKPIADLITTNFSIVFVAVYLFFAYFCVTFPDGPVGKWRKRLRRSLAFFAVFALIYGPLSALYRAGWIHEPAPPVISRLFAIGLVTVSLAGLVLGWRETTGIGRTRMAWVGLSMGALFMSYGVNNLLLALGTGGLGNYNGVVPAIAMCGLAYALLRHRLFDAGFAINRVLVYAVISGTLLLGFGLLEWLTHKVVHFESPWIDAGLAGFVFLAFHKVRDAAERSVERLFFHEWHRREQELRRFVKEAAFFLSPAALLEGFHAALQRFTDGAACDFYMRREDGGFRLLYAGGDRPISLDKDHPVCVALRAERAPVLLDGAHRLGTTELAVPITHRGVIDGIALLGLKPNGQSYRPDEMEVLGFAADAVGMDMHALEVEHLRGELAQAKAEASALRSLLDARVTVVG